jgi:hypothetical protein
VQETYAGYEVRIWKTGNARTITDIIIMGDPAFALDLTHKTQVSLAMAIHESRV